MRGTLFATASVTLMLSRGSISEGVNRTTTATIFVVEDDPHMRRAIFKALEAGGYRVLAASTGAEALALFDTAQPDLIILDLMLPDADGLMLTTSFQNRTSAPIIICSARQGQVDRVLSAKLGAADFVEKPFDLDDLEARVETVLRRSHQPDGPPPCDDIQAWRWGRRSTERTHAPLSSDPHGTGSEPKETGHGMGRN